MHPLIQRGLPALAALTAALCLPQWGEAQAVGAGTFTVQAEITTGLTVSCSQPLTFGTIYRPSVYSGGTTVTVAPTAGSVATSSSSALLVGTGSNPAVCTVTGLAPGSTPSAQLSESSSIPLSGPGGGTIFVSLNPGSFSAVSGGSSTLRIGGTLSIPSPASAENGEYVSSLITLTVTE
jgi:hypothetical protein